MANYTWPNGTTGTKTVSVSVTSERPYKTDVEVVPDKVLKAAEKTLDSVWDVVFARLVEPDHTILTEFPSDRGNSETIVYGNIMCNSAPKKDDLVIAYNEKEIAFATVRAVKGKTVELNIIWETYTETK